MARRRGPSPDNPEKRTPVEKTDHDAETAAQLQREIGQREAGAALETFMLDAFGRGGLDTEKIGPRSYSVRASLEYHLPFPGFVGEEMGVTFDRDVALRHPERAFLSWDHPMVRDVLDGLIEGAPGNASIARMEGRKPGLLPHPGALLPACHLRHSGLLPVLVISPFPHYLIPSLYPRNIPW